MSSERGLRIGEILVGQGVLTEKEVNQILDEQKREPRPFGDLAERLFDVKSEVVERAWIDQYLTYSTQVNLDDQKVDTRVLKVINRRQAWQFRILPIRRNRPRPADDSKRPGATDRVPTGRDRDTGRRDSNPG